MKKRILKILILLAVFIAGNQLFAAVMNSQSTESASDLPDPTLPVVYINIEGVSVNKMQGYTMEMDGTQIRDSIIPLTTDRTITLSYKAFGNKVDSVSYEVITPDTGERIENAKIGNFRDDGDSRTATFTLTQPILMDREYPIVFTVQTGGREIYYYSRLLQRADLFVGQYIDFVNSFYQTCINKQAAMEVNAYIEPDDTVPNNSFANVNIHSSLEQITWGTLSPQLFRKAIPCIREINPTTCSMTCDYLISAPNTRGVTEIYHVYEYYRMRYYNSRIMLLDFERQALQTYNGTAGQISASGVNLGVSTRDVQYASNESGNIVAFVQDGALWEFNGSAEKLSCIFTFHSEKEGSDERCDNSHYDVQIIRVAENGDVDFAVYGYMSRGIHEGKMGVSLCHYSSQRVNVEEKLFVPYNGSGEILKRNVEKLSYLNERGNYFLYMGDCLYSFDTDTRHAELLLEGIRDDCFAAAKSGRFAAWTEEMDPNSGRTIVMMNFDTEKTKRIRAGNGLYVRTIGFINDDLIYGTAAEADLRKTPSGSVVFAMKQVTITSFDDSEKKEYNPEGLWIRDVEIQEGLIEFTRIRFDGQQYQEDTTDDIMNNKQMNVSKVKPDASNTSRQGTIITLVMPTPNTNIAPLVSYGKLRTATQNVSVTPPEGRRNEDEKYFIYGNGGLLEISMDPGYAVRTADDHFGTAMDEQGRYIYERANKSSKAELGNEDIPETMLSGSLDISELGAGQEGIRILDLSGCTLQQVLYEVSRGNAVRARTEDGGSALIVGYDPYNTLLYNETTGEHYYYGINDSTALFQAGGNVFVSYLEDKATMKQ
ncbi:MAG: hypothetical protein E7240_02775 [Lachnospiraceae bacterium]|nr:hypothetical protein [Lachnospiraceae bacterium]